MNELAFCEQCEKAFYRKRSTKITCSDSCRKQKSRGIEPEPYWHIDPVADRYTDFLETVFLEQPQLGIQLRRIRDKWGKNAMFAAIEAVMLSKGYRS